MKNSLVAFCTFFLLSLSSIKAATITLTSDHWCPYACDPKSSRPGFMVEIAKEIFEKKGHKVKYVLRNWPRAITDVKSGIYDGLLASTRRDARGFVIPQVPTGFLFSNYWTSADSTWTYKDKTSLEGKRIGVINDYTYGDEVDNLVVSGNPSFKIVSGERPLHRLIQMTENKRIDGFVENPIVLKYTLKLLKKHPNSFRAASSNMANNSDLFIAFSPAKPKSKEYADLLDAGVNELRRNGRLKEILANYGLTDWKK